MKGCERTDKGAGGEGDTESNPDCALLPQAL